MGISNGPAQDVTDSTTVSQGSNAISSTPADIWSPSDPATYESFDFEVQFNRYHEPDAPKDIVSEFARGLAHDIGERLSEARATRSTPFPTSDFIFKLDTEILLPPMRWRISTAPTSIEPLTYGAIIDAIQMFYFWVYEWTDNVPSCLMLMYSKHFHEGNSLLAHGDFTVNPEPGDS